MATINDSTKRRHVVITGCSTGIGKACAIRLANAGFSIVAGVRTDADISSLALAGIHSVTMDVADQNSLEIAAKQITQIVGDDGLYGLVNNAGICVVGPVECISMENWRHQFEVNFFGAIAVMKMMLPLMRRCSDNPRPRIININSVCGEVATPVFAAYSASKFALRAMTDCLRLELRGQRIHVCSVMPGTIQTEIWRKEKEGMSQIAVEPLACQVYSPLIKNVSEYVFQCADTAIPADRVARAVERAMTADRPRQRYLVGWEAVIGSWCRKFIPERLFHFLLGRTLNVPCDDAPR